MTNWTFKIVIQIIHQKEWAEKYLSQNSPKIRQQKYFWHCYNQLCLDSNLLHQCSFLLSNQFFVTINCNVTTIDCNLLKISRKTAFQGSNSCSNFSSNTLWSWIQLNMKIPANFWESSTNGVIKQCLMNQNQKSTRDHIVKYFDPTYQR